MQMKHIFDCRCADAPNMFGRHNLYKKSKAKVDFIVPVKKSFMVYDGNSVVFVKKFDCGFPEQLVEISHFSRF